MKKKNLKKINSNYLNNDADNDDIINFENEEEITGSSGSSFFSSFFGSLSIDFGFLSFGFSSFLIFFYPIQ